MSPRASTDWLLGDVEINAVIEGHTDICDQDPDSDKRKAVEESLLWKLDSRLLFLILVGVMSQVDRSNIAAARLKGLEEDLHLTGQQFNTLISIMYVGYTVTQVPSNVFLDRLRRPSVYLSYCILLWGIISISIGLWLSPPDIQRTTH
ncbi:hypothetical protein SCLCIDRAFT_1225347 [Scleroderma citrinum Foug A]|uniref:Major facilitator superfamily (MFS) profile domain-containing protein n=1 Tax=Scleroderma citrinum Foug A TaxID=1036808 RepID=A0A0C2YKZ8_9AGAM|nr:hypothetical protein SCLCIDRAFT_1225347 [Scleroderma citrinum Foug A]